MMSTLLLNYYCTSVKLACYYPVSIKVPEEYYHLNHERQSNTYTKRDMNLEERQKERELRQEAKEKNLKEDRD